MADDLATLKTRLAAAKDAEHKLSCGAHAVGVDYDGQKVSFQAAGMNQLRLYIARLNADIDKLEGRSIGGRRRMVATF